MMSFSHIDHTYSCLLTLFYPAVRFIVRLDKYVSLITPMSVQYVCIHFLKLIQLYSSISVIAVKNSACECPSHADAR